ncbi:MAG: epimerase family protein [Bacteroidetes bacterium]|jgi:uncharacterized protein (TIGR01777 family)|nr:epimerase family protein [Bacteroidota bacterium]
MKKLVIAGGTGFLGKALTEYFKNEMDEIVILSRKENGYDGKITYAKWDGKTLGSWCPKLEGATAVINLVGKSVDCRYTEENKALILSSRLNATKILGEAIQKCVDPPKIWMNGSSATIYGYSEDKPMSESSGEIGTGFSIEVVKAWEKAFNEVQLPSTRKIALRISMVMGKESGVFPVLMKLSKLGLGGTMGSGKQQVSWIHVEDFCRITEWLIKNESASGPYNIVAPQPIRNKDMMKLFRRKTGMPFGLWAPAWMLEIGAFFIRTETELILKSRYAVPERLLKEGYEFKYKTFESCLDNLTENA